MAKIATHSHGAACLVRPAARPALGHPDDPRAQPQRSGRGRHRRRRAQRRRRPRPAVGLARRQRCGRLPRPRRELLRPPQRTQARRHHHLQDGVQHGAVPGGRPADRAAGSPVSNTAAPSLVLDTCWPPNALFFTPKRLLVRATEVAAATKGVNLSPAEQKVTAQHDVNYTTTAPVALQATGLTLEQNEAPMGTMQLVNASVAFSQSPGPLNLEGAALESYFGGSTPGPSSQAGWWSAIAPGLQCRPNCSGRWSRAMTPPSMSRSTPPGRADPGGPAHRRDPPGRLRARRAHRDRRPPCSRLCRTSAAGPSRDPALRIGDGPTGVGTRCHARSLHRIRGRGCRRRRGCT